MPHVPHAPGPLGIRDLFLDRLKNHHMGTPENLLYEIPPDPHPVRCSFPTNAHNPETKHNFIVINYYYHTYIYSHLQNQTYQYRGTYVVICILHFITSTN